MRLDWGAEGLAALAPGADTVIVVDVLSFSTAVDVAVDAGAVVLPYRWRDGTEAAYAADRGATLAAAPRTLDRPSLSPSSLQGLASGTRIVLPSPNGSALSFAARDDHGVACVLAGCLRNASAVAAAAARRGGVVAVIAAGERWAGSSGALRVALEDLLGAGAVVGALPSALRRSGEAAAAASAFAEARPTIYDRVAETASGRELTEEGFGADVLLAAAHDVSDRVPTLIGAEYRAT